MPLWSRQRTTYFAVVLAAMLSVGSGQRIPLAAEEPTVSDVTWLLRSAFLIFTMQAGLGMLECGTSREGNMVNVMAKNLVDLAFGSVAFWAFGFAFAFGDSGNSGFIASGNYFLDGIGLLGEVFFVFHLSFAATAATIVSGAMAERTRISVYALFSFFITGFVYPPVVHWAWDHRGWLAKEGFHDFAGCGVVHMVGGVAGLVGTLMLGPRKGRFEDRTAPESGVIEGQQRERERSESRVVPININSADEESGLAHRDEMSRHVEAFLQVLDATVKHKRHEITSREWTAQSATLVDSLVRSLGAGRAESVSNFDLPEPLRPDPFRMASPVSAILGLFILLWAWFGFNTGSTLGTSGGRDLLAGHIACTTIMSACAASMCSMVCSIYWHGRVRIEVMINGTLSGLVGITASCATVQIWESVVIGILSPFPVFFGVWLLQRFKIDDPVSAVPVHGFGGAWGLIVVGLFSEGRPELGLDVRSGLFHGGGFDQLGIQLMGLVAIGSWAFLVSLLFALPVDKLIGFRAETCDLFSLDEVEHGFTTPLNFSNLSNFLDRHRNLKKMMSEESVEDVSMSPQVDSVAKRRVSLATGGGSRKTSRASLGAVREIPEISLVVLPSEPSKSDL